MPKTKRYPVTICLLLALSSIPCHSFARTTFLECSLTVSTSNTGGHDLKHTKDQKVFLEIDSFEETIEVHTQSPSFPISLKIDENKKEWRTPDGFGYDSNKSSARRYSLERVYEDQISITQTNFELDRSTGELTQEISKTIGEDFTTITIIHGFCTPSKKQHEAQF